MPLEDKEKNLDYADEKTALKTIDRIFGELVSDFNLDKDAVDRADVARFVIAVHEKIVEVNLGIETYLPPDQQSLPTYDLGAKVEEMFLHKALEKTELFNIGVIEKKVRTQTGSIDGLTAYFDEPLSKGSSGILYRAQDPNGQSVVIKVLGMTTDDVGPSTLKGRLWREVVAASTAALLQDPHFIKARGKVFYFDPEVGFYLVLDDFRGLPLENLLKQYRENPPTNRGQFIRALILARQIGEALQYLHALGFYRLHFNPENILLDAKGRITLTGFGSVKRSTGTAYTQAGILSVPAYTSPEELRWGAKHAGPKSDLWILGVLLYELVAGDSPFLPGQSVMAMLRMSVEDVTVPILRKVAEPLSQVNPAIQDALTPEEVKALEAILKNLLNDVPESRHTAEDFLKAMGKAFPEVKGFKSGEVELSDEMKWRALDAVWETLRQRYVTSPSIQVVRADGVKVIDTAQGWSVHWGVSFSEPKVNISVSVVGNVGETTPVKLDAFYEWMVLCLEGAIAWIQSGKAESLHLPQVPSFETAAAKKEDVPIISRVLSSLQKEVSIGEEPELKKKAEEKPSDPPSPLELGPILDAFEEVRNTLLTDIRFKETEGALSVILNTIFGGYLKTAEVRGKSQEEFLREQLKRLVQFVINPEHNVAPVIEQNLVPALQEALEKKLGLERYALNPYQGLFFDAHGVLFHKNRRQTGEAFAKILQRSAEDPLALYREIVQHEDYQQAERGELPMNEVWKRVLQRYNQPQTPERIEQLHSTYLESHKLEPPTLELAQYLKERGYQIWLLLEESQKFAENLQQLLVNAGYGELCDGKIYSHEIGVRKSEGTGSFKDLIEQRGLVPEQLLFIGERAESLISAADVGLTPVLFNVNESQLLADHPIIQQLIESGESPTVNSKTDEL